MATRGVKPKPSFLKLVTKTARKGRETPNQPRSVRRGLPKPPQYLDQGAKEEWEQMSKDLYDCGILSIIDRAILAAYCTAWSRWVDAELALQASKARDETGNLGLLIEGRKGMVVNPLVGAANRTLIIVSRLCAELGMTPSSRSRVCALSEVEEEDPASKYID